MRKKNKRINVLKIFINSKSVTLTKNKKFREENYDYRDVLHAVMHITCLSIHL